MAKKKDDGGAAVAAPIEEVPQPRGGEVDEVDLVGVDPGHAPGAAADAVTSEPQQADGDQIEVTCLVAAGRRRANRRWPGGTTRVAAHELTEVDIQALEGDPMFTLVKPADAPSGR